MSIDINEFFQRGGRELVDLLEHVVLSVNMDALMLYLIREYRFQPRAKAAIALHDVFCAAGAPARISELSVIPPKEFRIDRSIAAFRTPETPSSSGNESEVDFQPPCYLFDPIAHQLTSGPATRIAKLEQSYQPERTPVENLPGGQMSAGQRAFVNGVWTPSVRPYLVSAGYWRVATIA